jgi:5-methyltetrahydrofolate corrinoid/iron sulfur protein methyltransferase
MILIGERINGGFKDISQAVKEKDKTVLEKWAQTQAEAGANYIDVNIGAISNKIEDFLWMIESVQGAVSIPISIDCNKISFLKEALKICEKEPLINSTTAHDERLEQIIPLAIEHKASLIGVCMDEKGSPQDANRRVELAAKIFTAAIEKGLPTEKLFLDPVVMPLKFLQPQANISSQTTEMKLINRIFLIMAIKAGLDAAICDVTDTELVNGAITAEVIQNKHIYSDSFLKAYHTTSSSQGI